MWLGFLNIQDMISQVNIYVMDMVWIVYDIYVGKLKNHGFAKLL